VSPFVCEVLDQLADEPLPDVDLAGLLGVPVSEVVAALRVLRVRGLASRSYLGICRLTPSGREYRPPAPAPGTAPMPAGWTVHTDSGGCVARHHSLGIVAAHTRAELLREIRRRRRTP